MKASYYYITDNEICQVRDNHQYAIDCSLTGCRQGHPYSPNPMVQHALGTMNNGQNNEVSGLDLVLSGKKELIRSKIEMLLIQIQHRRKINYKICTGIDYDSCKVQSLIFEFGDPEYATNKSRVQVEKMKFDLEREKRMEQASYFRDTAMLNKELKDTLIEYIKETQNEKLLGD